MRDNDFSSMLRRAALAMAMIPVLAFAACAGSQEPPPAAESPAASPTAPAAAEPATAPAAADPAASAPSEPAGPVTSLHQLHARTIEGKDQAFTAYDGKVVLAVNTASQCGYTPQYAGLEQVWKKYKDKGLVVLGFPSNDFGGQEPGTDEEVLSFCQVRYGVSFPLFSKSVVKGTEASPVFRFLAAGHGEPKWNFHKYLVDKKGTVVAAFGSKVPPDDPALVAAIEKALVAP
jgi:glutathione peroxidase